MSTSAIMVNNRQYYRKFIANFIRQLLISSYKAVSRGGSRIFRTLVKILMIGFDDVIANDDVIGDDQVRINDIIFSSIFRCANAVLFALKK